uniref:ZP domain-containing protein n=1 Tax=Parastrongyloides trichosuri TaxID=131310 RepID=A0A0N4ZPV9_PARTI
MLIIFLLPFLINKVLSRDICENGSYTFSKAISLVMDKESYKESRGNSRTSCWLSCFNDNECLTFSYNTISGNCKLYNVNGLPFGNGNLVVSDEVADEFYQILCIESNNICNISSSFDRYPQYLLIGHSEKVIKNSNGLQECMKFCLESREKFNIDCKSIMFNYENNECILNSITKNDYPELFVSNDNDHVIDYFENNCIDVECENNRNLFWIQSSYFKNITNSNMYVIYENTQKDRCIEACNDNESKNEEGFNCKLLIYDEDSRECILSKGSLIGDKIQDEKYYYKEKICLQSNVKCSGNTFESVPFYYLNMTGETLYSISLSTCLQSCLKWRRTCTSVSYNKKDQECTLLEKSRFSHPRNFVYNNDMIYFDNICEYDSTMSSNTIKKKVFTFGEENYVKNEIPIPPSLEEKVKNNFMVLNKNKEKILLAKPLETICKDTGIEVIANFKELSNGLISIKDHSMSCKETFINSKIVSLNIPYPNNDEDHQLCPGYEEKPGVWTFNIVITNNINNLEGIINSNDQVFKVSCDYSKNIRTNTIIHSANVHDSEARHIIKSNDDNVGNIYMGLYLNEKPVTIVNLGDEVEIRWIIENRNPKYDYSIDSCVAERLEGLPPQPPPLQLYKSGCPDLKVKGHLVTQPIKEIRNGYSSWMKIFRFEGSRKVKIRCSVNICIDSCSSTICQDIDETSTEGFVDDNSFKNNRLNKKKRDLSEKIITGVFSIIDNDYIQPEPVTTMTLANKSSLGDYCFPRITFQFLTVIFIFASIHSIVVIIVNIRNFLRKRNSRREYL